MTLHVVNEDGIYCLYRGDGDQISDKEWQNRPKKMELVEALADEHSGASILGNPDARCGYTDIVTGDVTYHGDDENLPWGDNS